MKSFYKEWLRKNNEENNIAVGKKPQDLTNKKTQDLTQKTLTEDESRQVQSQPSTSRNVQPSTSRNVESDDQIITPLHQTDIIYENNNLQMIVEQGAFKRQNRFRLQDHLFYLKINLKNSNNPVPLLKDILQFLEQALLYVMDKIKIFYNEKDANICFLTLHQNPMLIGLNSGLVYILF